MKIKLRDVTLKQYEKWEEKVCLLRRYNCNGCIFKDVYCNSQSTACWVNHKNLYDDKFLDQEIEVEDEDEPILTEDERNYLSGIIGLFDKVVASIKKTAPKNGDSIGDIELFKSSVIISFGDGSTYTTPLFKYYDYFKKMEFFKEYIPEELGL